MGQEVGLQLLQPCLSNVREQRGKAREDGGVQLMGHAWHWPLPDQLVPRASG